VKQRKDPILSMRWGMTVTVTVHPYEFLALLMLTRQYSNVGHCFKCGRCKNTHSGRIIAMHPPLCAVTLEIVDDD